LLTAATDKENRLRSGGFLYRVFKNTLFLSQDASYPESLVWIQVIGDRQEGRFGDDLVDGTVVLAAFAVLGDIGSKHGIMNGYFTPEEWAERFN
jgi:hypothetical protein